MPTLWSGVPISRPKSLGTAQIRVYGVIEACGPQEEAHESEVLVPNKPIAHGFRVHHVWHVACRRNQCGL